MPTAAFKARLTQSAASDQSLAMSALLTPAEMADADRLTIASGLSGQVLMARAGLAVADAVSHQAPLGGRVAVLCGPGNNGGDGYVAARILKHRGYRVSVFADAPPDSRAADAAAARAEWRDAVAPLADWSESSATLVVDALYGAGLSRDVAGAAAEVIARLNASSCRVIAVDVPSGIDGATGAVRGAAVTAAETVTFYRRKPGHLMLPGRLHCGTVRVADIGISDAVLETIGPKTFANAPTLWRPLFPFPRIDAHKYDRGHAVVMSGGPAATGAARLAARAALRAGAGLVTLASPAEALRVNAAHLTAVMLASADGPAELAGLMSDSRRNAICLGPALGLGAPTRALVEVALASGAATVLDADALTSFADGPADLFAAIAALADRPVVLTPHAGEFARLFGAPADAKLAAARAAAASAGAVVVLKGPDTVVAAPDGRAAIAANAPPWLATAGSGDVLAGMVTGLLAARVPAFEAASAAVWLHGEAGASAGIGLIAEDLPEALPAVLRALLTMQ